MPDDIITPEVVEPAAPPVEPGVAPPPAVEDKTEEWKKQLAEKDKTSWGHEKDAKTANERIAVLEAEIAASLEAPSPEPKSKDGETAADEYLSRIEKLEAKLAESDEKEEKSSYQKKMETFTETVREHFPEGDEELDSFWGASEALGVTPESVTKAVEGLVGKHYDSTGKGLTAEDAAATMVREFKALVASKRSNLAERQAVAKLYGLQVPEGKEQPASPEAPAKPSGDTLTSADSKGDGAAVDTDKMSDAEELAFLKKKHGLA